MAVTPATVATISATAAVKQLRIMLRNANQGNSAASRVYTDDTIRGLEDRIRVKKSKEGKELVAYISGLRSRLETERAYGLDVKKAYELVQHLPTQEGLPKPEKMESSLRAIAAVLKNSGVAFTNLEPPTMEAQNVTQEEPDDEDEDLDD